jgi:D-3-phosphoglycerate dehydrogenase
MALRVLVTDHPFSSLDPERDVLNPLQVELKLAAETDERSIAASASGISGMLVCYAQITPAIIRAAAAGGCRIISRYGIGYDNIDVGAATHAGIVVTTVPDYCLDEVADHTLALLLAHARAVVSSDAALRHGDWHLPAHPVHRLANRTVALIGFGAIGRRVAHRLQSCRLKVIVYDPYADRAGVTGVIWADSAEEAVAEADFITLHVPLNDETRHMVNSHLLGNMTRRPVLINTARGGLVDLDDAVAALNDGTLTGLALDVVEPEPLQPEHPLLSDPRVIITPHIAFHSEESQLELQRRAAEEVARVLRGELPRNPRNPEVLESVAARGG